MTLRMWRVCSLGGRVETFASFRRALRRAKQMLRLAPARWPKIEIQKRSGAARWRHEVILIGILDARGWRRFYHERRKR